MTFWLLYEYIGFFGTMNGRLEFDYLTLFCFRIEILHFLYHCYFLFILFIWFEEKYINTFYPPIAADLACLKDRQDFNPG